MEFLNYFLVLVVSYLGLIAGCILMLAAPEEKKPGLKYFNALNHIIFLLAAFLAVFFRLNSFILILSAICAVILFYYFKSYNRYISYLFFSIVFPFLSESSEIMIFSSVVFAYGLAAGAIMVDLKDKKKSFFRLLLFTYFIIIASVIKIVL